MIAKLLGFIVSETKAGNIGTTLWFETEIEEYRRLNAKHYGGNAVAEEYIRGDWSRLKVGEMYSLMYAKGFKGAAVLAEIVPVEAN